MSVNRRQFVVLTVAALAGCSGSGEQAAAPAPGRPASPFDAGPASAFSAHGIHSQFINRGFFVVSDGGKLEVLSSFCTHRHCGLEAQPDHSFLCPCHGSTFDSTGKVTDGPAKVDLPKLPHSIDSAGHLIVQV